MKHSLKRDENTGDIHITINVNNSLTNSSNSSAENSNTNTSDINNNTQPESKPFLTQLLEGAAIGAATALLSTFF
ncbi:hypothetical protein IQ264_27445 [Phormidium sp. LEGE 05292]|uniref:hypothetical protein n=1 Tax=[Phormidium] sp. LEGE 05292 TaxID=767427 RepID=UPI00187EB0C9|nr:hypothetical protein [Phormidium sp. LEGE 05292]MBE9229142.1 hypothetical protein [Phormidium sp. LEGE 05292]